MRVLRRYELLIEVMKIECDFENPRGVLRSVFTGPSSYWLSYF